MQINSAGLSIIRRFEGLRLDAYADGGGVWTIGFGHTRGVVRDDKTTSAGADIFLSHDLKDAEGAVNQLVFCELNPNQFSALVCLVFNIGEPQFATSTLLKLLNDGDTDGAAGEFHRWNHDNGKVESGLTRRRQAEEELFRRPLKSLAKSNTIQTAQIAGGSAAAISVASQYADQIAPALSLARELREYWPEIVIVVLASAVIAMVWFRIRDHINSVR